MEDEGGFRDLPKDAFEHILLRNIPPSAQRWLHRVCRWHWRDIIDERTPVRHQNRAKTLIFVYYCLAGTAAYILDNLVESRNRELWSSQAAP
ncbi:hypothetical protein E2562_037194 [Oryza meyeriana var. granulata]|uniref:F-box domain-containing protein n=1 Tax=Oryza meyeriana var. granulata TaxID=110450 RepID=A0A6G1DA15_9ORYZ|nr:hypothetical protein E2562_037194 [Oryza meyeriana var. granulata]